VVLPLLLELFFGSHKTLVIPDPSLPLPSLPLGENPTWGGGKIPPPYHPWCLDTSRTGLPPRQWFLAEFSLNGSRWVNKGYWIEGKRLLAGTQLLAEQTLFL